jgi:large subunit ribosomal protein L28
MFFLFTNVLIFASASGKEAILGSVAQLDRVPDYGSGGWRFEPSQSHFPIIPGHFAREYFFTFRWDLSRIGIKYGGRMSKVCQLTGKRPITGNNVSHSNRKTKRRFVPNMQKKRFFLQEEGRWITMTVSTSAIRNINKLGLYAYLKKLERKGVDTGVKL